LTVINIIRYRFNFFLFSVFSMIKCVKLSFSFSFSTSIFHQHHSRVVWFFKLPINQFCVVALQTLNWLINVVRFSCCFCWYYEEWEREGWGKFARNLFSLQFLWIFFTNHDVDWTLRRVEVESCKVNTVGKLHFQFKSQHDDKKM
jgi:hypothetical protein